MHHDKSNHYNLKPLNLWAHIDFFFYLPIMSGVCYSYSELIKTPALQRARSICINLKASENKLRPNGWFQERKEASEAGEMLRYRKLEETSLCSDHVLSRIAIWNIARSLSTETKWGWFLFSKLSLHLLCGEWVQEVRKEAMRKIRILSGAWLPRKEISVSFMDQLK